MVENYGGKSREFCIKGTSEETHKGVPGTPLWKHTRHSNYEAEAISGTI